MLALPGRIQIKHSFVPQILPGSTSISSRRVQSSGRHPLLSDFKPRFLEASHTSEDDLHVVADAVCGESSSVEEARTEAPTAPKRSDKHEPGCPAALAQHSDRTIRTKRHSHSFREN